MDSIGVVKVVDGFDARQLIGGLCFDSAGDKIGKIVMVYLDDATGEPAWAKISTSLFGGDETFVPLDGATADEHDIRVTVTRDQVKHAPTVDAGGHLDLDVEEQLYHHYGLDRPQSA